MQRRDDLGQHVPETWRRTADALMKKISDDKTREIQEQKKVAQRKQSNQPVTCPQNAKED